MSSRLEKLSGLLPLATIAFFGSVVSFCVGTFRYIGHEWLSSLDLVEMIAISWPVIPAIIIFFAAMLTTIYQENRSNDKTKLILGNSNGIYIRVLKILSRKFYYVATFSLIAGFIIIPASYSIIWPFLILSLFLIFAAGLDADKDNIVDRGEFQKSFLASIVFVTTALSFSLGAVYGGFNYNKPWNDLIVLEDGVAIYNVNIILKLSDGVLVRQSPDIVIYIKEDKISYIKMNYECNRYLKTLCNSPTVSLFGESPFS